MNRYWERKQRNREIMELVPKLTNEELAERFNISKGRIQAILKEGYNALKRNRTT